jgi:hypothetical protein
MALEQARQQVAERLANARIGQMDYDRERQTAEDADVARVLAPSPGVGVPQMPGFMGMGGSPAVNIQPGVLPNMERPTTPGGAIAKAKQQQARLGGRSGSPTDGGQGSHDVRVLRLATLPVVVHLPDARVGETLRHLLTRLLKRHLTLPEGVLDALLDPTAEGG